MSDRIRKLNNIINEESVPNPRYELKWEFNPRKGKTYVAISEPYEGDAYYEVPTNAKLRDFDSGGKYDAFVKAIHPKAVASFIFKCKEG